MYFLLVLAEPDVTDVLYYPDYGDVMSNICHSKCLIFIDLSVSHAS